MSTLSNCLDNLIVKYPQEDETIQRLFGFIHETSSDKIFTLQRLYDFILPSTTFIFTQLLSDLVEVGIMKKIVRIESPNQGGIQDFSSIIEVPEEIYDWRQETMIVIQPENIRILYQVVNLK